MALRRGTSRDDTLAGSGADDQLLGLAGNDRLLGGGGRDILLGGAGNDVLNGGAGLDTLRGDDGNDTYIIDNAKEIDRAARDAGIDIVTSLVSYTLGAQQENLRLLGTSALTATGNAQANVITGNSGANLLSGGAGADRLLGGSGNDTLVFDAADVLVDGGLGIDTLRVPGTGKTLAAPLLGKVQHIEILDLRGSGANGLDLDTTLVASLTGSTVLRVLANRDDKLRLTGDWLSDGTRNIGGLAFDRYIDGSMRVDVQHGARVDNRHVIALASLDGNTGFRVDGAGANWLLGLSTAGAGDINGDGLADLIMSSRSPFAGSRNRDAYVVFGRDAGFAASFSVAQLNGTQGLRIEQSATDSQSDSHRTVLVAGAGDINGDGLADVFVTNTNSLENADETAYVVFGSLQGFDAVHDVSTQDGNAGVRLHGLHKGNPYLQSVSAGDLNGDGYFDLVIGDRFAGPIASNGVHAGTTYIVFGHADGFPADIDVGTLNGSDGLRIDGLLGVSTGRIVSGAGDINGDGIADLLLDGKYLVFGSRSDWPARFDLANLDGTKCSSCPTISRCSRPVTAVSCWSAATPTTA